MSRRRLAVPVGIILIGLFLLAYQPTDGGCHGGCIAPGPPPGTPGADSNQCNGDTMLSVASLLDTATTGGDPPTNLELYSFTIPEGPYPPGTEPDSWIYAGEATAFYVASGTVTFIVGSDLAAGSARVVESSSATPTAIAEGEHDVAAGGTLFVDAQEMDVHVGYVRQGTEEAVLVISSAVPCVLPSASPPAG